MGRIQIFIDKMGRFYLKQVAKILMTYFVEEKNIVIKRNNYSNISFINWETLKKHVTYSFLTDIRSQANI